MDEIVNVEMPWNIEVIPDTDKLFRRVHFTVRERKSRIPTESAFGLRLNEKYLSFNWNKYINVEETFISTGLHQNFKQNWVNVKDFNLLHFKVDFLKTMPDVSEVLHRPVFHGDPSPIGLPNNRSHTGLYFVEDDDSKFRSKMAEWAQKNINDCDCPFEYGSIDQELDDLRKRGNDTKYHKA